MIRELINYTDRILSAYKERGLVPRDGLHLLIRFAAEGNPEVEAHTLFRRADKEPLPEWLLDVARREQAAWMIDPWKCLDAPEKEIHSVLPYCLAFKRQSWIGGEKFKEKEADPKKTPLDQRIGRYFDRSLGLLLPDEERERQVGLQFKHFCQQQLQDTLTALPDYEKVKEADYIVLHLSEPQATLADYEKLHARYLRDKLFNTDKYNTEPDDAGRVYGTSNFFSGYGDKKPYLMHQTAPFDISGRISDLDARLLNDFRLLADRNPKILPTPLPVFVDWHELKPLDHAAPPTAADELNRATLAIFNDDPDQRPGYQEIIERLSKEGEQELGNYYLLFYQRGEIKDFDFVSKFEYGLYDPVAETDYWRVQDFFPLGKASFAPSLKTVFAFQSQILPEIFNNALVQRQKDGGLAVKYFEEIEPKYIRPDTVAGPTHQLVLKYRAAFYDFVYKSQRQGLTAAAWRDILQTGIMADLRSSDDGAAFRLRRKLNVYLSLNHLFDPDNRNFNGNFMPTRLPEMRQSLLTLLDDEAANLTTDEDFAFAAGQMIYYLLYQSKTEDKSNDLLEPFLQKNNSALFKEALAQTLRRYKHAISFHNVRFRKLAGQVLGYEAQQTPKELLPFILCGYFSPSALFRKKNASDNAPDADADETPETEA